MFQPGADIGRARLAVAAAAIAAAVLALFAGPAARAGPGAASGAALGAALGTLDLSGWDVAAQPLHQLTDGWAMYWNELVPPAALATGEPPQGAVRVRLPSPWTADGTAGGGMATYHLRIRLPATAPPLAIRLPAAFSASMLWANGEPLIVNGRPGGSVAAERRVVQDRIAMLPGLPADPGGGRRLDLVLHVSNHLVFSGGLRRAPAIGTPDALYQARARGVGFSLFVAGACAAAGLVFLGLFATRRRERGFAWFGGLSIGIGLAFAYRSDTLFLFAPWLAAAYPNPPLVSVFLLATFSVGFFLLVLASLYPQEISGRAARVACLALAAYVLAILAARLLDVDMARRHWQLLRSAFHVLAIAALAYALRGLVLAALRGRRGAAAALAATLVLAAAAVHDIIGLRTGVPTTLLIGLALIVFVVAYASILGGRLNAAFAATETLSRDLHDLNLTLEARVADRTADLRDAVRRAEDADRAKSQFLAAANHDLRQPLHAMALIAGVLDHRVDAPDLREQVDALKACLAGTQHLLGGILDMARLDAGAVHAAPEPCALDALLAQAMAELAPFAAERGVRLRQVPTRRHVRADPVLLARIVGNLAGNAVRHAPGGRVLVGARRRGGALRLEVWDDGIGIPEADRERIFGEYQQVDRGPGGAREGLGLGLAIARRFARMMGSDIALCSIPGRGSRFSLALQLAEPPPAPPPEAPLPGGSGIEGLRVMVIDDDAMVLRAVAPLLAGWGCVPMTAADAAAAMALLSAGHAPPDVLIVDSHIGPDAGQGPDAGGGADAGGHRAIDALRAACGHGLPAAIVTGDTAPERLRTLSGLGFPVLHKPIRPAALASLIRALARSRPLPMPMPMQGDAP